MDTEPGAVATGSDLR